MTVGTVGLAIGTIVFDEAVGEPPGLLAFSGSADAARSVLSTMNAGVLTFTALTFSITVVVLVLTSGQFSPRVLRTFLNDRASQFSLGLFVSTYVFILIVLREVRGDVGAQFVPRTGVTIGFALTGISIMTFVYYVHHVAHSVRAATIISRIADETRETISRMYPAPEFMESSSTPMVTEETVRKRGDVLDVVAHHKPDLEVCSTGPGVLNGLKLEVLIDQARNSGSLVVVVPRFGDFVRTGGRVLEVYRRPPSDVNWTPPDLAKLRRAVVLQEESSIQFNVAFGFRQLVDIAERALSPGVNDPTTAAQCLNHIHDLLGLLAVRPFPSGVEPDADGIPRLVRPLWSWDDYVHLAFDEIRHWGADSLQMHQKLRRVLDDLLSLVGDNPNRRAALAQQRRLLGNRTEQDLPDSEQRLARREADGFDPSAQGP
ncbi:DUF2254 domain-containing protein [soil metagenome]